MPTVGDVVMSLLVTVSFIVGRRARNERISTTIYMYIDSSDSVSVTMRRACWIKKSSSRPFGCSRLRSSVAQYRDLEI